MLKTIFNTLTTKVLAAALSLFTVILTSQILGTEGRGEISLITADIGIIILIAQIVGGPSMVYLYPRSNPFHLLLSAFLWNLILPSLFIYTMHFLGLMEHGHYKHLAIICTIYGLAGACQVLIAGAQKITWYNLFNLQQTGLLFFSLLFFFFVLQKKETLSFVWGLYITYSVSLLVGLILSFRLLHNFSLFNFWNTAKEALVRGFTVQLSNLIQFFNFRLSYFFLSKQLPELGILSNAAVLAEAVWLIGNSVSLVQYMSISNEKERHASVQTSFFAAKICFWATGICVLALALIPKGLYILAFGKDFGAVKMSTLILCPGIWAIGFGLAFSHHFSGTGRFRINNIAVSFGLLVKIIACLLLIPKYSGFGAAAACTASYCTSFLCLLYHFRKETSFSWKHLIVTKNEWREFIGLLRMKKASSI